MLTAAVFGVRAAAVFGVRPVVGMGRVFARIFLMRPFIMTVFFVHLCTSWCGGGCLDGGRIG